MDSGRGLGGPLSPNGRGSPDSGRNLAGVAKKMHGRGLGQHGCAPGGLPHAMGEEGAKGEFWSGGYFNHGGGRRRDQTKSSARPREKAGAGGDEPRAHPEQDGVVAGVGEAVAATELKTTSSAAGGDPVRRSSLLVRVRLN
jgi:hypothetical protein